MKTGIRSVLTVAAATLLSAMLTNPASSATDYQYVNYPCVDMYGDPLADCIGDAGNGSCLAQCSTACSNQYVAAQNACNKVQDPIENANCLSLADTTDQACQGDCIMNAQMFPANACPYR